MVAVMYWRPMIDCSYAPFGELRPALTAQSKPCILRSENMHNSTQPFLLLATLTLVTPVSALEVLIADDDFPDGDLAYLVEELTEHNVTHLDNGNDNPTLTNDAEFLAGFDVVIFRAGDDSGRATTAEEQAALEAYIQGGGNLIVTGYDMLASPDDPILADVVRSREVGGFPNNEKPWLTAAIDHFILNGPFGDFRGVALNTTTADHDSLAADSTRGAISLGVLVESRYDKIIFTDLPAPGGSVGAWNGNEEGWDWNPDEVDGDKGLAILRNWLAGLSDADGDGVFDADGNENGNGCGSGAPMLALPTLMVLGLMRMGHRGRTA